MELAYDLRLAKEHIQQIQRVSLDMNSDFGLKIENNLPFGSSEWFRAIDDGLIKKKVLKGTITKVYMSGHNDYQEFEMESDEGKVNLDKGRER